MAQIGKLYNYYLGKIFRKNGVRIIIFTLLIGVVWGFVIPYSSLAILKSLSRNQKELTEEQKKEFDKQNSFRKVAGLGFGEGKYIEEGHLFVRKLLKEDIEKLKEGVSEKEGEELRIDMSAMRAFESSNFFNVLSFPFTGDSVFFFCQTEAYSKGIDFWKLLNDISWGNLSSFFVLFGFIYSVLDKTFFSPRQDGEEITVLTLTPGVKRSDLFGSKIFAFLTFYFIINVFLFLIPFGVYYGGMAPEKSFSGFALLSLWTTIAGPILFFSLIFTPYLFFGSLSSGIRGIISSLLTFFPMLGGGIKIFSSTPLLYIVEEKFFNPIWFTTISLIVGIIFLSLYYLRYQEEDLG